MSNSMLRKRFEDIKKYIRFANHNNPPAGDKPAQIRPLHDRVNTSLQQFGVFAKDLIIDEQMLPHFWQTLCKDVYSWQPNQIRLQKLGFSVE